MKYLLLFAIIGIITVMFLSGFLFRVVMTKIRKKKLWTR